MKIAVVMENIGKSFDRFVALRGARFSAQWGEVHALLGENGAGKSTLMNVLAGLYMPDCGSIQVDGERVEIVGPAHAKRLRIGMVHQNFKLVMPFSVLDNVVLSNLGGSYRKRRSELAVAIRQHSEELDFGISPEAIVGSLSIAEQQRVEILKGLIGGARIFILDEPSAVLTDEETERMLQMLRRLAEGGACIILVTHKLNEVKRFADSVTVMRAGETVAEAGPQSLSEADLARLVVGEQVAEAPHKAPPVGEVQLAVRDLVAVSNNGATTVRGASFEVRAGEIYGIAGVGGNGQAELAEVIMGLRSPGSGALGLCGVDVTRAGPQRRRALGLAFIPADRYNFGLAGSLSIDENFCVARIGCGSYGGWTWVRGDRMRADTAEAVKTFNIVGTRNGGKAAMLSGGNAQKLVIAREFSGNPKAILAHTPTRGLDVRAYAAVHEHLLNARDRGAAVLLISEDLDEITALSDRVGVMNRGRIVREFTCPVDRHQIGEAMFGHA
jgi:ABC-type uncharacterized transport system ATPase subunit